MGTEPPDRTAPSDKTLSKRPTTSLSPIADLCARDFRPEGAAGEPTSSFCPRIGGRGSVWARAGFSICAGGEGAPLFEARAARHSFGANGGPRPPSPRAADVPREAESRKRRRVRPRAEGPREDP